MTDGVGLQTSWCARLKAEPRRKPKEQHMTIEVKNDRRDELSDERIARVSGGLNPQPLPPGHELKLGSPEESYRISRLRF
jgi:hypothetical protein